VSGTTTKVLRGKGRIGVGVWKGRAKAQEKAQQLQGRWRSNLTAQERVGPANKPAPGARPGLNGCGRFRQVLSARLCLGCFLIQKRISFSLVVVPFY
jgi:hypothetical protein